MEIYLAGGVTGNLSAYWKSYINLLLQGKDKDISHQKSMEIFLAGGNYKDEFIKQYNKKMEIYLAGEHPVKNGKDSNWDGLNILETFYYLQKNKEFPRLINHLGNFLLDSGAFTFMQGASKVDFDAYVEDYAKFINKWDIEHFFELDIDSVVGISEVERLRAKLETLTGKKPIPVWHKSRGKDYFIKMCENYPYVAIVGIVTKEIPTKLYEKIFPWFINTAHKYGCKIHGLGYTNIKGLHKYRFDSVDSTAWLYGNMSGHVYQFDAKNGLMNTTKVPEGKRLVSKAVALNNFNEWVRFQKYARIYL